MTPVRATAAKSESSDAPLYLNFDDNSLLQELYGEHDRNLARIEQKLGVWLTSRGNQLAVAGPSEAANAAKDVLLELYELLKQGQPVGSDEVEAAVGLASGKTRSRRPPGRKLLADEHVIKTRKGQVMPRSENQAAYVKALYENELVFGIGPAGTGKTYLAVAMACAQLTAGKVDRIILSRPAVEAGERLGFLPGDLQEKVDPYLRPLYDALHDMMPGDRVAASLQSGEIEVAPLAFMRGRTLANAFVILDEAQNATAMQMKMFLTRLGQNARMVVTGDLSQVDLPSGTQSGLREALSITEGIEGISVVRFTGIDVVRHSLVTKIVNAYEEAEARRGPRT